MAKLAYTFKTDILFKMLFVKYPELLKRLVAELLSIEHESIEEFLITNPEIVPDNLGDKFCRLDINMLVDGQKVDLEIQVNDEKNYPERSLYYWAREFSSALSEKGKYIDLPRTIIISIIAFELFDCNDYHSEFRALEVTRHTQLTDKMSLHYYELPKLPDSVSANNIRELWLKLFEAETEEDLEKIEALGVPIMTEAVQAYHHVATSSEFRERERLWSKARHDEAQALYNAKNQGAEEEREKWEGIVAEQGAALAEQGAALANKDATIAEKDTALADKDAMIAKLEAMLRTQNKEN